MPIDQRSMATRTNRRTRTGRAAAALLLLLIAGPAPAEDEFAWFRLTGTEGHVAVRDLDDGRTTQDEASGSRTRVRQTSLRSEVFLMTRSFVYHPNFLALDIGLGPIFERGTIRQDNEGARISNSAGRSLYDLTARASFLRGKPYSGALYFEHLNPNVSVGPAQVVLQQTWKQGAEFSLLAPVTPVPLQAEASRQRLRGRGADLIIDENVDRYRLTAERALWKLGTTQLRFESVRSDSSSGAADLPIQRSDSERKYANLDTRLQFGTQQQYRLINLITYSALAYRLGQERPPDRTDLRGFLDTRALVTEKIQAYGVFDASRVEQGRLFNRIRVARIGASLQPFDRASGSVDAHAEDSQALEVGTTNRGIAASATYVQPLPMGFSAQAAYSGRYDDRSQRAALLTAQIIGERQVLAGLDLVPLNQPRVVAGSVVVSNEARTQVFVEGIDYRLSEIGVETRLQRLAAGGIVDGQAVLVDYRYAVGGTFDYTQREQNASLSLSYRNYLNLYVRRFEAIPTVTAGTPLVALNTVRSTFYLARADVPLGRVFVAGGRVERENRRETLLPYRRLNTEVYLQMEEALLGPGGVRLGQRRQRIDYDRSDQDVDLTGYDLRYWVRTPWRIELLADLTTETDTGAAVTRRRDFGALRARWRYRQLFMTFDASRTREAYGVLKTTRTLGKLLLQRDF